MERAGLQVLLFTDIEGSTALLQRLGPRYRDLITRYDALVRTAVDHAGGEVVSAEGDGYFVVFDSVVAGLGAAFDMQLAFRAEPWPERAVVRVRMGLHVGEVLKTPIGYIGLAIHHAARVTTAAHGGQVLVSEAARSLVDGLPDGMELRSLGPHILRNVGEIELFQVVAPGLDEEFPALRSVRHARDNLPVPRTSMIGRDRETTEVGDLLDAHRLVTLVGSGGCGKTRLAIRVASEISGAFPDGVRLVELAALSDPAGVPAVAAAAVGAPVEPATTDGLIDTLGTRQMLIVLDNCEHLLEACGQLISAVLSRCPNVRMLTATREPVGVSGEAIYPVPSLAVAPPAASAAGVQATDSARLFEDRVGLVRPGYTITPEDAAVVAEICRRLDGVPLAIELAAARCRHLTPVEVASRLDDRFRLLTGGARDALPRQQTLLATIDWSYGLLTESERLLFARLAVFHGGAALEAVEAVCVVDPLDAIGILELIGSLVDKSILRLDETSPSMRVELPETIRQFATDRLIELPDVATLRDRHAAWFGALEVPLVVGPWHHSRTERFAAGRADQDNLAVALDWATGTGSADALRVIRILAGLHPELREPADFGSRIRAALDAAPDAPASLRAVALARLGWEILETDPGNFDAAIETSTQALALARESGDVRTMSEVAMWAGFTARDSARATAIGLEAVAAADATGDAELAVYVRLEVVKLAEVDVCAVLLEAADQLARRDGLDGYRASIAYWIAQLASHRGDDALALQSMDEALAFDAAAPTADRWGTRTWGAIVLADQGHFVEAEALLADALYLLVHVPTGLREPETRAGCAHVARLRGDAATARIEADAALGPRRPYLRWTDGLALLALASADRLDGQPATAVLSLLPILIDSGRVTDVAAQAMEELAACLSDLERTDDAASVLASADEWRRAEHAPLPPARRPAVETVRARVGTAAPLALEAVLRIARETAETTPMDMT